MDTITLFLWGVDDVYAGSVEADPTGPLPIRSTPTPPPADVPEGKVALWRGGWIVGDAPAPDLPALRAAKNDQINAARLAANFGTFTHDGKLIACDQLSRSDIDGTNGYVALHGVLPSGWPGGWKAVDNSYVAIADVAAWKAFYGSMFAAGNANFARSQALKAMLAAADTPEEIAAIAWGMEIE